MFIVGWIVFNNKRIAYLTPPLIFGVVIYHTLQYCRFLPLAGEKFCLANKIASPSEYHTCTNQLLTLNHYVIDIPNIKISE